MKTSSREKIDPKVLERAVEAAPLVHPNFRCTKLHMMLILLVFALLLLLGMNLSKVII